jgi:hypothetical protein
MAAAAASGQHRHEENHGMAQVSNAVGSVVSEGALVEVEALDILSIIEHFVEERQITFRTLFMQFNRSTARASLVQDANLWGCAA